MATKAIRIFYNKVTKEIVWTYELQVPFPIYTGVFPTTIKKDLIRIPDKPQLDANGAVILDVDDNPIKLGGIPSDYACIEEINSQRASDFLASDENSIVDGALVIGAKRVVPEPIPPRDLAADVDDIRAKLKVAGITGF